MGERGLSRRGLFRLAGGVALGGLAASCGGGADEHPQAEVTRSPWPSSTLAAGITGITKTFTSRYRSGNAVTYQILLPPGHDSPAGLPLCLVLHGMTDDHADAVGHVHLDSALAAITGAGLPPMALVAMDGGAFAWWHPRPKIGDDSQGMVLHELLPRLRNAGLRTERFGLFGWSMGGYGSLLLAEKLGRERVAAVSVDAPAIWLTYQDAHADFPFAFDGPADYRKYNVFTYRPRLAGIPVRVVCGDNDGFADATREFVKGVPDLVGVEFPAGGHDPALWARTAPAQLTPIARALG